MSLLRWIGVLGCVVSAGCQGVGGKFEDASSASASQENQVEAALAPELRLAFGRVEDWKEGRAPRSFTAIPRVDSAFVGSNRIRVPEMDQVLLVLRGEGVRSAAAVFSRNEGVGDERFEFTSLFSEGIGSSHLVLGLTHATLLEAFRSEDRVLRGELEVVSTNGRRKHYALELPLSIALPNLSLRSLNLLTGKEIHTSAGKLGVDAFNGDLILEDLQIRNPSPVIPLRFYLRLATRGDFKQVTRMDHLPRNVTASWCDGASPQRFTPYYFTGRLEMVGLLLEETDRTGKVIVEEIATPSDWVVLTLQPQSTYRIRYRLQASEGSAHSRMVRAGLCRVFHPSPGVPGARPSLAKEGFIYYGSTVRGSVQRTLVVSLEGVGVQAVEAALQGVQAFREEGRILAAPGASASILSPTARVVWNAPDSRPLSEQEWEGATPELSTGSVFHSVGHERYLHTW